MTTLLYDSLNHQPGNCWNGFLFHLHSKKPIKITLITIRISLLSLKIKPKVYYQENYDSNSNQDKWIEMNYNSHNFSKEEKTITMNFDNFIIPNESNSSICIIQQSIWFLKGISTDVPNENDHFIIKKGWPMNNQNTKLSTILYHFIGRIETQIYNQVYSNIENMKKVQDITFHFI